MTSIFGYQTDTLSTAGGAMHGAISMGNNPITDVSETIYDTNPLPDTPPPNGITLYTSSNQLKYKDQTGTVYVVGTAVVGGYLPLAGGTMSGTINMGSQNITELKSIAPPAADNNLIWGLLNTPGQANGNTIAIGTSNTMPVGSLRHIAIGRAITMTGNAGVAVGSSTNTGDSAVGIGFSVIATGGDSVGIGSNANSTGSSSISIGSGSRATTPGAISIGPGAINATNNSCLVGNTSIPNIRPNSLVCDLGTVAASFKDLYMSGSITGPTTSRTADNIVSNTGASVSGNVAVFSGTTGKVVSDSGTSLAAYLPLTGGTMLGNINMGGFAIGDLATANGGVCFGNSANCGNGASIAIGNTANASAFGSTAIGNASVCSANNSLALGIGSNNSAVGGSAIGRNCLNSGTDGISIGTSANSAIAQGICIGAFSGVSAANAIALGASISNTVANSLLIRASANIRSSTTSCDLGTTALPFQSLYLNTGIEGTAGLVIGPTTATSIAIGRAAITTTVNGTFATALPAGSWYSTTTYNPSFAAGVNRLTPPTAATAGTLVDFTHALGVLTYTGARTRQFRIAYNITFTSGSVGSNMTFFNSIAAGLVIGTQSQQKMQIFVQNSATQMCIVLHDNITLTTGQSVQLAGVCATLSAAVSYNFVSCAISAMPN